MSGDRYRPSYYGKDKAAMTRIWWRADDSLNIFWLNRFDKNWKTYYVIVHDNPLRVYVHEKRRLKSQLLGPYRQWSVFPSERPDVLRMRFVTCCNLLRQIEGRRIQSYTRIWMCTEFRANSSIIFYTYKNMILNTRPIH